jgi:hypothetical protein
VSNRHSCSLEDGCAAHLVWIHLDEFFDVHFLTEALYSIWVRNEIMSHR